MQDLVLWLIGMVVTVGGGIVSWVITMIFGKFRDHEGVHVELDRKIDEHKLHVAEKYTPKTELKDLKDTIVSHLIRIEDKLDKKADKDA